MINLIVADCTPSILTVVESVFPSAEFEIFPFTDGGVLIERLESIQPGVILLNLSLETKDGYDVCRFLNNQERFKTIPIFLLKGAFERINEERMSGLDYQELIAEPFDTMEILRKVRDILGGEIDPQTLPEEPVLDERTSLDAGLEEKIKSLIAGHMRESEERIFSRLKARSPEGCENDE